MQYYLNGSAAALVTTYFRTHPDVLAHETEEARKRRPHLEVLQDLNDYFRIELEEPEHADVKRMADRNNGLITAPIVLRWLQEIETERRTGVWGIGAMTNYPGGPPLMTPRYTGT